MGDDFVVYDAKTATGFPRPYLLINGAAEPIMLELEKNHGVACAVGRWLLGYAPGRNGSSKTCAWRVSDDGSLEFHSMWQEEWGASSVIDACGDMFIGLAGFPAWKNKGDSKAVIWPDGPDNGVNILDKVGDANELTTTNSDICLGTRWKSEEDYASRALLWRVSEKNRIILHPEGYSCSCPVAICGKQQARYVTERISEYTMPLKRAAMWSGTANSCKILAPQDSYESEVVACTSLFQAGFASYLVGERHTHTPAPCYGLALLILPWIYMPCQEKMCSSRRSRMCGLTVIKLRYWMTDGTDRVPKTRPSGRYSGKLPWS